MTAPGKGAAIALLVIGPLMAGFGGKQTTRPDEAAAKMASEPTEFGRQAISEVTTLERGRYLVEGPGHCFDCHTPFTPRGQPIMELAFAGGRAINGPWGEVSSGNITRDASGVSHYDEALFISTMRTCRSGARELQQIMPCRFYDNMTDADLGAIFAWIQTLKPMAHRVNNTDPPTPCKLCGGNHGLREMN